jgi:hypothetical protein
LVYDDDDDVDDMLGGSVHTDAEPLIVASMVIGPEVNADTTKCMVMSGDQNAGRGHSVRTDNSSFGRVGQVRYWGTTLTDRNFYSGRN